MLETSWAEQSFACRLDAMIRVPHMATLLLIVTTGNCVAL